MSRSIPEFFAADGATAYVLVARFPSNTYIGATRTYGNVYSKVILDLGDVVADLPGGYFVYLASRGAWYEARFTPQARHLFERGGATPDQLPDDLVPIVGIERLADVGPRAAPIHLDSFPDPFVHFGAMDALMPLPPKVSLR